MDGMHPTSVRIPPHSVPAEQAVLGGLMLSERAWDQVADRLQEADFYRRDHQLIFRAISELARARKPRDAVTLGEWFESQGHAEQVGGSSYVLELASTTPSAANIAAYTDIVREKSLLRRMIDVGSELAKVGFDPGGRSSLDLIGEAQTRIGALLTSEPCELEQVHPVMGRVFQSIQARYESGGGVQGLSTGLNDFDAMLGGLRPGQLGIIAARPKMGKTTLAQNIAEHVGVSLGKPVAIFSFEMQPDELGERMLSSLGDIDASRVRSGGLAESDWTNFTRTVAQLKHAPIYISRPRRARVEHVIAQVRRLHAKSPLALCIIDYLQLLEAPGENRAQALADVTRALKLTAAELRIPIVLLSQLNRGLESRTDKRPIPSDLRDSGAIEQDADFVVFIYRDEVYHRDSPYRGTAELIIALQRNGPAGDVRVAYRPDRFRFENLSPDWRPPPPPERTARSRAGFNGSNGRSRAAGFDA